MQVIVNISGLKEEIDRFKRMGGELTDFTDAMELLGGELKTFYSKRVIGSEGGAIGRRWQPLSPAYKRSKRNRFKTSQILVATGTMQDSFRAKSDKRSLKLDNTVKTPDGRYNLLSIHHEGRGNNPKRPVMLVTKEVKEIVQHIIEDDIERKLEKAR